MRFMPGALGGLVIVDIEPREDDRGYFARTFCAEEFARAGLPVNFVQCNASFNPRRGTLRGLHYQDEPHPEGKLVRCTRGAVFDVAVDIRRESKTAGQWSGVRLSAKNSRAFWIPPGFAHGFVTLMDDTELFYQMSEFYHPGLSRGLLWNDPGLAIAWPVADPIVSARDANHPCFAA